MVSPFYVPKDCKPAYQLDWSFSVFWRRAPATFDWLEELQVLNKVDDIRILQHAFQEPKTSQFLISSQPDKAPLLIAQRVKGRLQRLVRNTIKRPFQRNYGLRSVGSTRREKLEQYLATQLDHHPMADQRVAERFQRYQIFNPNVDLREAQATSHARYWYNLHIALVNDGRYREIHHERMQSVHDMIYRVAQKKTHRLSRAAVLPDHIHLMLGCPIETSPLEVVLSYMNNLSYACGQRLFMPSYFVGTFSEYDLGVIPHAD